MVGLTDEGFILNKVPGSSKKSFGLRSDGKILHAQSMGQDFCPKFQSNDIIGCGIAYISRKIFFTRNGELLGKPFDLQESYTMYASASLTNIQDSVIFCFTGPFKYNFEAILNDEKSLLDAETQEKPVNSIEIYKLVRDYLIYQGFSKTLKAVEQNVEFEKTEKSKMKSRSYSTRISERYDSIDIDPACETCQTYGKICKFCLKKIMENVEASSNIRLPESRGRCDSVDLASLYLKTVDSIEPNEPSVPSHIKDVIIRSDLRKVVLSGNMKQTIEFLANHFPDALNDEMCMLYIHVQEFIQLIKDCNFNGALDYARSKLKKFQAYSICYRSPLESNIFVWEIVGLLAYNNPFDSPLASLLSEEQLENTADLVNSRILIKTCNEGCSLENILKQVLATQYLYQESILMAKPSSISLIT